MNSHNHNYYSCHHFFANSLLWLLRLALAFTNETILSQAQPYSIFTYFVSRLVYRILLTRTVDFQ